MEKSGEVFIDRSKVRILLCDNDVKSSLEVFTLLCKCSYQVTSVRSPRQVIDALNAEGREIDIILSEFDLPMSKGCKMLKYIRRDKELKRIPVIMMSARDEVSSVIKCLKLGAADYLVKPLRINELLNLWTHVWKQRRLLGLAEKNILNYDFDLAVSDPSDANTNSTTLFSDDTDDRSQKIINPDACSSHQECEITAAPATAPVETPARASSVCQLNVPAVDDCRTGQVSLFMKKSKLKIGESSAFFTYVKSSMQDRDNEGAASRNGSIPSKSSVLEKLDTTDVQVDTDTRGHVNRDSQENHTQGNDYPSSNGFHDSLSEERPYIPSLDFSQQNSNELSNMHLHRRSEQHRDVSGVHTHPAAYPYYVSGVMNQVMMAPSAMYQNNTADLHNCVNSNTFNHIPQHPHVPGMTSFPYYTLGVCVQPGQMPAPLPWPSYQNPTPSSSSKGNKVYHREAVLMKFRQKRKERCFKKKVRYVNRKNIAERRPRVKGQFVRKVNGINVDLNGLPTSADDYDDEEEEDDDDQATNTDSFPEDDSMFGQQSY